MATKPWMPVYTRDILASCADMSAAQFGGYMRLLLFAWDSGGLPNDMEACCRIAGGLSPTDWQAVRKRLVVLDAGTSEERLSHPRLEAERAKASDLHQKRCDAMSRARRSNPKNQDQLIDQSIDQSSDQSIDQFSDTQPQPQPQPHSKNETPNGVSRSVSAKPRRTYRIHWDCETGFQGVGDADLARWKDAYPGVDLQAEIRVAHAWLVDNPTKAGKRNWGAFLNRWFARKQEKGGSPSQPAAPQKSFRPDAGLAMTASEYAEWRRNKDREEFLRAKARKRGGGVSPIGEAIHERYGTQGPAAGSDSAGDSGRSV